jgi:hypothetical protein
LMPILHLWSGTPRPSINNNRPTSSRVSDTHYQLRHHPHNLLRLDFASEIIRD